MSRDITEDGPRLEVRFSDDELDRLLEGLDDGDYQIVRGGPHSGTGEIRGRHPGGSVVRVFPGAGLLYVYPPGGTSRPTGPIAPFTPLKDACNAANARLPSAEGGDVDAPDGTDEADQPNEDAATASGKYRRVRRSPPTRSGGGDDGDE